MKGLFTFSFHHFGEEISIKHFCWSWLIECNSVLHWWQRLV